MGFVFYKLKWEFLIRDLRFNILNFSLDVFFIIRIDCKIIYWIFFIYRKLFLCDIWYLSK